MDNLKKVIKAKCACYSENDKRCETDCLYSSVENKGNKRYLEKFLFKTSINILLCKKYEHIVARKDKIFFKFVFKKEGLIEEENLGCVWFDIDGGNLETSEDKELIYIVNSAHYKYVLKNGCGAYNLIIEAKKCGEDLPWEKIATKQIHIK